MTRTLILPAAALLLAGTLVGYLLQGPSSEPVPVPPDAGERNANGRGGSPTAPAGRLATDASVHRRLADLEARIEALEAAGATAASAAAPTTLEPMPRTAEEEPTPAELAWFRTLRDEVERQDQLARKRKFVTDLVLGTGADLSAAQRERVVDVTVEFRDLVDATIQEASRKGRSPEERRELLRQVHEEYRLALEREVPPGTARTLLEKLGPVPGYPVKPR